MDTKYFSDPACMYWSSTTEPDTESHAYIFDFCNGGDMLVSSKSSPQMVRAVCGGHSGADDTLTDNGDGTVTDTSTGLMWEQDGSHFKTWEQALAYCEGSELGHYTDWRLPTIKELLSIVDYRYDPTINPKFLNTRNRYWSSTTYTNGTQNAFGVDFIYGAIDSSNTIKNSSWYVRAVRGGQTGLTNGLVASYPFNGNANDISGNGNNGVNYGATPTVDRFGKSNSAYSFDGVDDYIEIDKIASQLKGVGTGTISVWFKVKDDDQSDGSLFSYGDGLNVKYSCNSIFVGPLSWYLSGEGVSGIINPNLFFGYEVGDDFYYYDSKWHHAVFLMGSNYNGLYMDGKKVPLTYTTFTDPSKWTGNANTGNILWTNIQNASIGRACADYYKLYGQSSTYYFTGSIDDVRIYNRALSEDEVKQIYTEQPGPIFTATPDSRSVSSTSGTTTFNISNTGTGTMPWTATVTTGGDWLSITSGASGTDAGTITCAYTANTGTTSRTGTIRVTATGSPKDVTVIQEGEPSTDPVISGSVKTNTGEAISGVAITFSNNGGTATTDAGGNYSRTVPYNWSGRATPAKTGYKFTPSYRDYSNITTNRTGENYVAGGLPGPEKGWFYPRRDLSGSNYYPYPSTVKTGSDLAQKVHIAGKAGSAYNTLTGDVTGDDRLEIITTSGNQLFIYDDTGKLLKNVTLGSTICFVTMIEDINGDGIKDIGIGMSKASALRCYFYDGQGNLLKTLSDTGGYDAYMWPVGLLANGDIIVSYGAGYGWSSGYRGFGVFDHTTNAKKWLYKVGPCHSVTSVSDYNDDGLLEFANYAATCHNGCSGNGFNGNGTTTTDGDMWLIVVDEQGNQKFSFKYPSPSDGWAAHYFVDLNHDGNMEILGTERHDSTYYPGVSQIHLLNASGIVKTFSGPSNILWSHAVADVNGDGNDEVVAGDGSKVYILDFNLSLIDSTSIAGEVQLICDLNGDGNEEIVILDNAGKLTVLGSGLNVLSTFNVNASGKVIASDLDRDGIVELICLTDGIHVLEYASTGPVISGAVKTVAGAGIAGVTITFSSGGGSTSTDAGGNYSKAVPNNYSGTATPSKSGYTFTPNAITYANVTASQTSQNYIGSQSSSRAQFLGVWSDGVWIWDKPTNKWTMMTSTASALQIAAGKVDTDGVDDLIGVWASGLYVRQSATGQWLRLSGSLPTWIASGDLNNDGRDDVIGTWAGDGVYYRNSATGAWVKLSTPARQLASSNIGGTRDDLAVVFNDGLWIRYSADASWRKIDPVIPFWITVGDMNGDNRADIVGSYSSGTWYRNSATATWTKITTPAEQLAAGDIDGDGRDDLAGIWSSAVWIRYGATGQWQQITPSKPKWITTGRMAGAIQAAGSLDDPMASGEAVIDLSKEGPCGIDADTGDSIQN